MALPKAITIKYGCDGTCKAQLKHPHMKRGDLVVMVATNTDVTVDFLKASPFRSGNTHFSIPRMTALVEVVSGRSRDYPYTLTCSGCPSGIDDPSMIIDP